MEPGLTLTSPASPDAVFAYLATPRNLVSANRAGLIVDQSAEPTDGVGSWTVMAFDQLRIRVEYTLFDRPSRIAARIDYSGFGSGGRREIVEYALSPGPGGGTEIAISTDARTGGATFLGRLLAPLAMRRLRARFAAIPDDLDSSPE